VTQAADDFRPDIPSTARIYDYYLGGKDNYPADRAAAEHIIASMPSGVVRTAAVQNRKFLMRAVRHLTADLGMRQFLDIGTGLPTMNSVHQVAQSIAPESRVVYVDHDPIVLAHSRNLLHGNDRTTVIRRDLRDPTGILADPQLRAMLDFSQPVVVLLVAVLHFVSDEEDPYGVVRALMDPMPAGSYLVVSHFTADSYDEQADAAAEGYENASSSVHSRTRRKVAEFFSGYDLIDPGELVWAPRWRRDADEPEDDAEVAVNPGRSLAWCGVGRKVSPGRPEALPAAADLLGRGGAPRLSGRRLSSLGPPTVINPDFVVPRAQFQPDFPNVARMYDYYLGGKDNYPADRAAAERIIGMMPDGVVRTSAVQNRKFLMRAVRHLTADLGVRQFLDVGAGLPTMNSVHQVAQLIAPESRVVYVDNDPIVLAHSRNLLHGNDRTTVITHDLRDPDGILGDEKLRALLDLRQPVAVLLVAVLQFIPDADDPYGLVRALMDPMPAGSFLAITHFTADSYAQADVAAQEYDNATSTLHSRHRSQVMSFFDGCELLPPRSIVWTPEWRRDGDEPEDDPEVAANPGRSLFWCGVARKARPGRPGSLPPTSVSLGRDGAPALSGSRVASLGSPAAINPEAAASSAQLRADIPNVARMYDYMLGGKDNYPSDRAAAERTFAVLGEDVVRGTVLQNRQFLGRAVRYLAADLGIRQFLDIGTGLPTMNSVHEVTQSVAPDSRVVYVDNDPVVLAHSRDMLHGLPGVMIVNHDLRDPRSITTDPRVRAMLDFDQPVAVLLIAILHFVADSEDPAGIVSDLMAQTAPGSCLVISHLTADHYTRAEQVETVYADTTPGLHLRARTAVESMFCGLPLLPPGELTYTGDWHPDSDTAPASSPGGSSIWCGIAQKP